MQRGCLNPVNSRAHLDGVEVDLQYPFLRPHALYKHREISLKTLSHPTMGRPKKHILRSLLRYCAGSALTLPLLVFLNGPLYLYCVESVMLIKSPILGGYHSPGHPLRHLVNRHPVMLPVSLTCLLLLIPFRACCANEHQRSIFHRYETIYSHGKHGAPHKENQYPEQYLIYYYYCPLNHKAVSPTF